MSLFYPDDKDAVYGHVARNVNMIKTFSEMMQPYVIVKSFKYIEEMLRLSLEVRGCEFLDSAEVMGVKYELEKVQNKRFNFWTVNVIVVKPEQSLDRLLLQYQCDGEFTKKFENLEAETHFVRMR